MNGCGSTNAFANLRKMALRTKTFNKKYLIYGNRMLFLVITDKLIFFLSPPCIRGCLISFPPPLPLSFRSTPFRI